MIVRDVDVLVEAARRATVSVTFSVPTLDPASGARPSPAPRRRGSDSGRSGRSSTRGSTPASGWRRSCPGLSDRPELLADVVRAARDAGATSIWTNVLYLRPGTREHFLANLGQDWPELVPRYERLYAGRAYLGKDAIEPIRREVTELRERFEIADRRRVRILPSPAAAGAGSCARRGSAWERRPRRRPVGVPRQVCVAAPLRAAGAAGPGRSPRVPRSTRRGPGSPRRSRGRGTATEPYPPLSGSRNGYGYQLSSAPRIERQGDPDEREDQPERDVRHPEVGLRRIDQPVDDDEDREGLVDDEVDARVGDLQLCPGQEDDDDDERHDEVEGRGSAQEVDRSGSAAAASVPRARARGTRRSRC